MFEYVEKESALNAISMVCELYPSEWEALEDAFDNLPTLRLNHPKNRCPHCSHTTELLTHRTKCGEVLSGHRHHNITDTMPGVETVMTKSFLGMDDFCISQRIYGDAEQKEA